MSYSELVFLISFSESYMCLNWVCGALVGISGFGQAFSLYKCVTLRPVHLLRVFLLRVLESDFSGESLSNSADMRIPTP